MLQTRQCQINTDVKTNTDITTAMDVNVESKTNAGNKTKCGYQKNAESKTRYRVNHESAAQMAVKKEVDGAGCVSNRNVKT